MTATEAKNSRRVASAALAAVLVLTFVVYLNSLKNDFVINWDDNQYVTENDWIKDFSWKGMWAIFNNYHQDHYHPLTDISHAFEIRLFGMNPGPFHAVNLALHLANVALVFGFFMLLFKRTDAAFICALFMGIHPMHVESVAWITERRDVLYTFFFLAALLLYLRYLFQPASKKLLIGVFLLFLASCFSKSAAITLPLVLLLLDHYYDRKIDLKNVLEKVPFFVVSLVFGIVTIYSQSSTGATALVPRFAITDRLFLCSYALGYYLIKFFVPTGLSALHLYPLKINGWLPAEYYLALPLLVVLTAVLFYWKKFRKELIFGFSFFVATLLLVIQIVPVGRAIVAERYTYVPYLGLLFIGSKLYCDLKPKTYLQIVLAVCAIIFSIASYERVQVWKNGETLFTDAIEKDPAVPFAYYTRGYYRAKIRNFPEAISDFDAAIRLDPKYAIAYDTRGVAKFFQGNTREALADYDLAISYGDSQTDVYHNRAVARQTLGDYQGAIADYTQAISTDEKSDPLSYTSRGDLRSALGDYKGALADYDQAIRLNSRLASAWFSRASLYYKMKDDRSAIADYQQVIKLEPANGDAYYNLGAAKANLNMIREACNDWNVAQALHHELAQKTALEYCR